MARISRRGLIAMSILTVLTITVPKAVAAVADPLVFLLSEAKDKGRHWILRVPDGYSPALAQMRQTEGVEFTLLALYPSYGAFVAGVLRCGHVFCGDEVSATISLRATALESGDGRTLRATMEADPSNVERGTQYNDIAIPPGYVQAFRVTRTALPGRSYTASQTDYLIYEDDAGGWDIVGCGVAGANPTCLARSFDKATGIAMSFTFPKTAMADRAMIDKRLRGLLASWRIM